MRPTLGATKLTVLVQRKGSRKYKTLKTVTTNSLGYWTLHSSTQGAHWRVRWVSPTKRSTKDPDQRALGAAAGAGRRPQSRVLADATLPAADPRSAARLASDA